WFNISGTLQVRINNTNRAVNETISLPGSGNIPVVFPSSQRLEVFTGSITIDIGGVFSLSGTVSFTRNPLGEVQVSVPDAVVAIHIPNGSGGFTNAFYINCSALFSIGGTQGFKLQDLRVNGFSIFGVQATIAHPAVTL